MVKLNRFPVPTEGIHYQGPGADAVINEEDLGKGTLFISESVVSWISSSSGEGFNIQYKKISLHGISRDQNLHPNDCVYLMVSGPMEDVDDETPMEGDGSGDSDEDEIEKITEIRFIPESADSVEPIYKALTECTLLHPDPTSDSDEGVEEEEEEEDEDEDFEDAEGDDFELIRLGGSGPKNGSGDAGADNNQYADADLD